MLTPSIRTFAFIVAATRVACGDTDTSQSEPRARRPGSRAVDAALPEVQMMEEKDLSAPSRAAPPVASVGGVAGRVGFGAGNEGSAGRDPSQVRVTDSATVPSMLIRTGNAQVEVDSLEIAMQQVRDLAQRLGGFIANTQLASGRDQIRSATMEMKVPAARWTDAVSGLKPIGKVEALNEFSEDVGEEYVDVTARVQNSKRLEA